LGQNGGKRGQNQYGVHPDMRNMREKRKPHYPKRGKELLGNRLKSARTGLWGKKEPINQMETAISMREIRQIDQKRPSLGHISSKKYTGLRGKN